MQARSWVILTGHSRGMGLAIAQQALQQGHAVLGISRTVNDNLLQLAHQHNAHLEQWAQDLSDGAEAAERLSRWMRTLHSADMDRIVLINNAAVLTELVPLQDVSLSDLARSTRIGLEAPMQLMQAWLEATQAWVAKGWRGQRQILNISSGLGRRAMASSGPYCAVKAGLDHLSRCVALEQARDAHGARIASLAPGVIATDMQAHLRAADPNHFPDHGNFVALKEQNMLTSPDEAARKIWRYLDSDTFGQEVITDLREL
ncbi:MAG: hypothetical protein RL357_951 [Pseudomonadota bacterium]